MFVRPSALTMLYCGVVCIEYGALWGIFVLWVAPRNTLCLNEGKEAEMNIFVEKGATSPMDVSTILSKLGHVYMSNFGLAWVASHTDSPLWTEFVNTPYFLGLKNTPESLHVFMLI